MEKSKSTPARLLRDYLRKYPRAIESEKRFRSAPDLQWPEWCWLPMAASYAIITDGAPMKDVADALLEQGGPQELSLLAACLAWRQTKTIYRFDPALSAALTEQPLEGDLPASLLYRLPEWCVWIEAPEIPADGAFAWLEYDFNTRATELRLLYVALRGGRLDALSVPLILGDGGLAEAHKRLVASGAKAVGLADVPALEDDLYTPIVAGTIQMILYLCSAEPDLPAAYKPAVRRPGHSSGPSVPRTWDVGERIGATIRAHQNQVALAAQEPGPADQPEPQPAQDDVEPEQKEGKARIAPRPHIRRAHWHTYRIGEGRTGITLKWVPPVLVGGKGLEDLPATIRAVK